MPSELDPNKFRSAPRPACRLLCKTLAALSALALAACGGGSPANNPGPPRPSGDFTLSVSPSNLTLPAGTSLPVSVSATPSNGFSSTINVQASGLPAGVTASPATLTVTPGTSSQLTLTAEATATPSSVTVSITGSSGALTHNAQLALTTTAPITSNTPPFRTRFVRTDAGTEYFNWINSHWIIYNPPTSRFFVTDPATNQVFVLDSTDESLVGSIRVPGAYGIDDTPDHLTLYVGTQIGDVYAIDPVAMKVTKRYVASEIGPSGFRAYSALAMADGRLALLGGQGGIPVVDGFSDFALWNPSDNSISIYVAAKGANHASLPAASYPTVCDPMYMIFGFNRTPDRSRLVLSSGATVCEIDVSTGDVQSAVIPGADRTQNLVISPDGNWIVFPEGPNGYGQVAVVDAHTLVQSITFTTPGDTSSAARYFIGPDSRTLYTPSNSIVYAIDLTTGHQIGWFPNIVVEPTGGGMAVGPITNPNFQAMDNTGLLAGPLEEGVGFLDTTSMRTGAVGTQFQNGYLVPATGPASGGTATRLSVPPLTGTVTDIYVGTQKAYSTQVSAGFANMMTPPGAPGPADAYVFMSDGGMQLLPQAFSYGPTILQIIPGSVTTEGGPGMVFGMGLGPLSADSTIPSDLQIRVGGQPATITAYQAFYGAPPFPMEEFAYTIPPGTTGPADVTVSTGSGSATVSGGLQYLPPIQRFSLPGAALAQGIYDPHRDLYYFTDLTSIRVFSRTQGSWLAPILLPNARGLWGIALSPDGTRMAVADATGLAIYVLSPTNAFPVQKFLVPQVSYGTTTYPIGVAISDAGPVYFSADVQGGTGYNVYYKLNTTTGQVTPYVVGTNSPLTDQFLRVALKSDNSLVYGNDDGQVFSINTATDQIFYEPTNPGCCYGNYDLALSGDQSRVAATSYFYDSNLNAESYIGLNYREQFISYLYGMKLSADGRLLFQPTNVGIDVIDGRLGNLITRLALPVQLSPNYDALVADGTDNILVAITGVNGDGIAVIDLSSIPEPPPLPYELTVRSVARSIAPMNSSPPRLDAIPAYQNPRLPFRPVPHVTNRNFLRR